VLLTALVTGAAGYIGSVLVRRLLEAGWSVAGFDNLSFGGESLLGVYGHPQFHFMRGDVRDADTLARVLERADAVVHLAAIVGDPACRAQPELARDVNLRATLALFEAVLRAPRVKRFVFASTCSNYGRMGHDEVLNEESPLMPLSLYAETKVEVEKHLLGGNGRDDLSTTVLRFATVYGTSPRMRFDLTVNDFVRQVVLRDELVIFGEQFWRPYCHVEDLARSCVHVLNAPRGLVHKEVFGVGDTRENYQKQMIAAEIIAQMPGAKIRYVKRDEDPRDYRVDFTKIRNVLGFAISRTVPDGIREVRELLEMGLLADPFSPAYSNT
jgi:nucleoside-diphosphate-sugar epimerase